MTDIDVYVSTALFQLFAGAQTFRSLRFHSFVDLNCIYCYYCIFHAICEEKMCHPLLLQKYIIILSSAYANAFEPSTQKRRIEARDLFRIVTEVGVCLLKSDSVSTQSKFVVPYTHIGIPYVFKCRCADVQKIIAFSMFACMRVATIVI